MCDKIQEKENRNDHKGRHESFYASTSIITKKSFLQFIKGYPCQVFIPPWPRPHSTVYPKANTYYALNEDTNPFDRFQDANPASFPKNVPPHFESPTHPFLARDPYSEEAAKRKCLETKPTSFVIFGKPGLNSYELAKTIADTWGCVLISPESILQQEIEKKSETGMYISKILKAGGCVGPNVVMNLIEDRINMRDVMHRGYVLEGLPLIPNNPDVDYSSYPAGITIPSEEAKSEISSPRSINFTNSDVGGKEDTEKTHLLHFNKCICKDESSKTSSSHDTSIFEKLFCDVECNYEEDVPQQVDDIFSKWHLKPTIIIYIMCPKEDVLRKRQHFKIDPTTGERIDTKVLRLNDELQNYIVQGPHEGIVNYELFMDNYQNNHLLKRITDAEDNVVIQCEIYERFATPVIDKWTILHKPQNVIRVDGRTSVLQMFRIVSARLRTLPLQRPIAAKKFFNPNTLEIQNEDFVKDSIEFEIAGKTNEEIMDDLMTRESISPRFPWRMSTWKFVCPVELAKGRTAQGEAKHAVRFMNNIFFLSSQEAADLFVENPRPFLLHGPRPTCKIAVVGPKYSGKTQLSLNLANAFDGILINVSEIETSLLKEYINEKVSNRIQEIAASVIKEVQGNLESQREARESARKADLQAWCNDILDSIDRLNKIVENRVASDDVTDENEEEFNMIRKKFQLYNIEHVETDQRFQDLIKDDIKILCTYAPEKLRTEEPPVPELTDRDPQVLSVLEERVKYLYDQTIDLGADEKVDIIIKAMKTIPEEVLDGEICKDGNFVLDGMYADIDVWTKFIEKSDMVFENTIVIFEQEPYDHLINKWIQFNRFYSLESEYESEETHFWKFTSEIDENESLELTNFEKLEDYIEHLKQFESQWNDLKEMIGKVTKNIIECDLHIVEDISTFVIKNIKSQYEVKARIMTEEEINKENELLDMITALYNMENLEDIIEGEESEHIKEQKINIENHMVRDIRRLGDTNHFCPVALFGHNVFWKGMEEFSATFMNKIYLLSSANAREEFVQNPTKYSVPLLEPPLKIPPLRVSIIGPIGSGKSKISSMLGREYGLLHVDHFKRLSNFMKERAITSFDLDDVLITDEEFAEVELPDESDSEKYNTDQNTIHTFIRRYWEDGGFLPKKMLQECLLSFFNPPYSDCGAVFDGFPSCIEDVELALENYAVPEVEIEMKCTLETTLQRMVPKLLSYWSQKQDEKRRAEESRYNEELEDYVMKQNMWVAEMMKQRQKERLQNVDFAESEIMSATYEEYEGNLPDLYFKESDPEQAAIDEVELEEIWQQEHPKPVLLTDWEDPETVEERIVQNLREVYESDVKKLDEIRKSMESVSIPWIEISGEKSETEIFQEILEILDNYNFRDNSVLERTYTLDLETAEKLLDSGYYFLSSFGRLCPIQLYERQNPFEMFFLQELGGEIIPVIHRQYIYFLGGKEAFKVFSKNPLKYLKQDSHIPLISSRISIIGPPKSGKTTLAKRFARTYGMKVITRGKVLRYLLKNYNWIELAQATEKNLRTGHSVSGKSLARAVEMYAIDPLVASQGFILDGFPANRAEYEELALLGIQPMIVLDLKASLDFCLECLSYDYDETKKPANYSPNYLSHRYSEWQIDAQDFRKWLKKFSENIVELDASRSKWGVWMHADRAARSKYFNIKKYFREADYDKVHSLQYMCVTPYEFKTKQSVFESFCPVCLLLDNEMRSSLSREGMVQFRDHFYWICPKHMKGFTKNPTTFIPPLNTARLPKDRPRALEESIDVEHGCLAKRLRVNGFCLVTYGDDLPNRNLVPGRRDLAAIYQDKIYLFCSSLCREKFLAKPTKYSAIRIHFPRTLPPIELKTLPNLGYLEQTVAKFVVEAAKQVTVQRPKLPGLSASITAAIYIGIYIKIHNPNSSLRQVAIYEKVARRITARNNFIETVTANMKKKLNPYIVLPKQMYSEDDVGGQVSVSSKDSQSSRKSNTVKFRRTLPTEKFDDPEE